MLTFYDTHPTVEQFLRWHQCCSTTTSHSNLCKMDLAVHLQTHSWGPTYSVIANPLGASNLAAALYTPLTKRSQLSPNRPTTHTKDGEGGDTPAETDGINPTQPTRHSLQVYIFLTFARPVHKIFCFQSFIPLSLRPLHSRLFSGDCAYYQHSFFSRYMGGDRASASLLRKLIIARFFVVG